jgi:hypothetical protein
MYDDDDNDDDDEEDANEKNKSFKMMMPWMLVNARNTKLV